VTAGWGALITESWLREAPLCDAPRNYVLQEYSVLDSPPIIGCTLKPMVAIDLCQ